MKTVIGIGVLLGLMQIAFGQDKTPHPKAYWNTNLKIVPFRLPPAPPDIQPEYEDLDQDGDPDLLRTQTAGGLPVLWIDDNDNMQSGDVQGDMEGDCLLVDRNRDGQYGGIGDLVMDWVPATEQQPAMEVIADYPAKEVNTIWPNGHYMWILDTDKDHVFNYVDWNTFRLESWAHSGGSAFFPDYSGKSMFMKVHAAVNRIEGLKKNWENPFLFYDPDEDGLSEMAVRFVDSTSYFTDSAKAVHPQTMRFSGKVNWVSIAVDLDNDNRPGDDFDFDFTLGFRGGGFDYTDQVHAVDMQALPGTDSFFLDPRLRQLKTLVYAGHEQALPLVFNRGKWQKVYFVFDEDDDCHRWERVEFYDPRDPFKIGKRQGGIDDNQQSDPAGDRGEWDLDNSGHGQLYISRFDGRLHLYGAEWGCWRVDQTAAAYQGWDRRIIKKEPEKFATVKYEDRNKNGFIDQISYDWDGDTTFETVVDLLALGLDDRCPLINVSGYRYEDYEQLQKKMADEMWTRAGTALRVARNLGLDVNWYARWAKPTVSRQKYSDGYWLQYYLFRDLCYYFERRKQPEKLSVLYKAYYSGHWQALLNEK